MSALLQAIQDKRVVQYFQSLQSVTDVESELNLLDRAYYDGNPLIPDSTYDSIRGYVNMRFPALRKKVGKKMETENSVWPKAQHEIPMGSLLKVNDREEFAKWYAKYSSGHVVVSHKVDGSSIELTYEDGKFVRAVTRGDGLVGDDITPNGRKMQFPKEIPLTGKVFVRGEVVLFKEDFERHFKPRGDKNPRNSAAGSVRRLDGRDVPYLRVLAFDLHSDKEYRTKFEKMTELAKFGFATPTPVLLNSQEDILTIFEAAERDRDSLPYEIDGLVVEENDIARFEQEGVVDNRPRAARAYKFEAASAVATLLDVVWQVGKVGTLTPVAVITPTDIQGVTITRVMLNNMSHINELGLQIGSKATLIRANDVIPKIKEVQSKGVRPISYPTQCPSCGSNLDVSDLKHITCSNHEECPAQTSYRITSYLSTLDVKGIGDKIIDKLLDAGIIREIPDLYRLNIVEASKLEGISDKVLEKSIRELITKSSKLTLPKFIDALSIKGIGASHAEKVMTRYPTIREMFEAKSEELTLIDGIGPSVATDFIFGLNAKRDLIERLLTFVTITAARVDGKLSGKVFCFTGFRDAQLEEQILALGGKMSSSVTKATTHLVAATLASMTTKMQKAKQDGKEVISKDELLAMIAE